MLSLAILPERCLGIQYLAVRQFRHAVFALRAPLPYNDRVTVRAVLFDVGDTLWGLYGDEHQEAIIRAVKGLPELASLGDSCPPPAELLAAVARSFAQEYSRILGGDYRQPTGESIVRRGLQNLGLECLDGLPASLLDCIMEADVLTSAGREDPGMIAPLARLRERGLLLGAVSNTYWRGDQLRRALDLRGFLRHLSVVIASSELGLEKPHESLFREPLRILRVEPREAVFVGDNLFCDVRGARTAGLRAVQTVQFRRDEAQDIRPDAVIEHLRDLPDLLESW